MKVKSAELEEKIVNNTATKAEENEYYNLDEKMIEYRKGVKLSDVINHPKLLSVSATKECRCLLRDFFG